MARLHRIAVVVAVLVVLPALAGCANFDPDSLDVFGLTEKKKIPGDRKPVFPEGVPGVTQGVPPQYIKGNQAAAEAEAALAAPAPEAAPPPDEPKAEPPKPKRKAAAKPKPAAAAPVQPVSQQPQQQQATPQPWPQGSQPAPSGTAAWPAPPPAGTFSR
jgi:hypothetical protein